ncbi:tryptophan synthase subunit alpha, partial [Crossiella equi]|uniref:tryptophan synthase subunit alpha n=1 Tax=Crossiella equi TaxID=130796 RepID=UPI001B800980
MISLSEQLGQRVRAGRKLLMPYLMAGVTREWVELIPALAEAGVDGLEIGLPFSDPMIDGVTVQKAASRALSLGATPSRMLDELSTLDNLGIPLTVMTYANVVFAHPGGSRAFLQRLADSGVAGV